MTGTALDGQTADHGRARRKPRRRVAGAARARAYAQARRHSALVRLLRFLIPAGSLAAFAALVVFSLLDPFSPDGAVSVEAVGVQGTKITMQNPRMTGHRGDNRPYEVTAAVAVQDARKPNVIELQQMRARLTTDENGGQARLTAVTGVFDSGRERLHLRGDVHVETDGGQQAELLSAQIDFKANTVTSREPVKVTLPNGVVEADNLDVADGGAVITFTGRVRSVFADPEAPQGALPSPSPAPPPVPTVADPAPNQVAAPVRAAPAQTQREPVRAGSAGQPAPRTATARPKTPTRTSQAETTSHQP